MITVRRAAGLVGGFISLYPIFTTPTLPGARVMTSTSALPAQTTSAEPNATNETNDDVVYWACISPDFRAPVSGFVNFTTPGRPPPSKGTGIIVDLSILDGSRGPFTYHIHERPLYSHGDCESAAGHFDPLGPPSRPADYACDPADRASCEAGDLSGKYGKIPAFYGSVSVYTTWTDEVLSVKRGEETFLGGRSVVVHANSGDRIACADIIEASMRPAIGKHGMWGEWGDAGGGPATTTGAAKPVTSAVAAAPGTSTTTGTKVGTTTGSTEPTSSVKPTNSVKSTSSAKSTSSSSSVKPTGSARSTTTITTSVTATATATRSTSTLTVAAQRRKVASYR